MAVALDPLMERTSGAAAVRVALLDGPVAADHPELAGARLEPLRPDAVVGCAPGSGSASVHGTFMAGILAAARESPAPGICPGCTLLLRPIFRDAPDRRIAAASLGEIAEAIGAAIDAGARIVNLSAAPGRPSTTGHRGLETALDRAARRGALVVAAAGNQGMVASSPITRHPWVIPVVAYGRAGRPLGYSNLAGSIGRRGVGAPGEAVESLDPGGGTRTGGGTSVAAARVTGTLALLSSLVPRAGAAALRSAIMGNGRRTTVTPPVLDAEAALQRLQREVVPG